MYWSIGLVLALLGVLCLPVIGEHVAVVIIGVSFVPIVTVQHWFGPLINRIADASGYNRSYLLATIVAAFFFCLGVFGFVKALFGRRPSGFAALGILSFGYLVVTVFAYFRLGQGWKY
jgi:hypothetical protein